MIRTLYWSNNNISSKCTLFIETYLMKYNRRPYKHDDYIANISFQWYGNHAFQVNIHHVILVYTLANIVDVGYVPNVCQLLPGIYHNKSNILDKWITFWNEKCFGISLFRETIHKLQKTCTDQQLKQFAIHPNLL